MSSDHQYIFDERFAEGFLHKSHRVFGFKLKPFSTWHRLQLEWINSKMLIGGAKKWDVYAAAKICSSEYPEAADVTTLRGLKAIWWQIRFSFCAWRKEAQKFYDYLDDYYSPPKLWGGKSSSKEKLAEAFEELYLVTNDPEHSKAAQQIRYQVSLEKGADKQIDDTLAAVAAYVKQTGRSPKEAWDMPMGELSWMTIALAKLEGQEVNVWTPMDEHFFQQNLIVRKEKIALKADEIAKENPDMPQNIVNAMAPVRYWEEIVAKQKS